MFTRTIGLFSRNTCIFILCSLCIHLKWVKSKSLAEFILLRCSGSASTEIYNDNVLAISGATSLRQIRSIKEAQNKKKKTTWKQKANFRLALLQTWVHLFVSRYLCEYSIQSMALHLLLQESERAKFCSGRMKSVTKRCKSFASKVEMRKKAPWGEYANYLLDL